MDEDGSDKRLGTNISELIFGVNFGNSKSLAYMGAEVMILDIDVFCSRFHFGSFGEFNGTEIVFECSAMDNWLGARH